MEIQETPEEIAKRASQEDPMIMYLIVRESLEMSIGKTAAQCAHASQMLTLKYMEFLTNSAIKNTGWKEQCLLLDLFKDWLNSSFRKVVLKADEKEWIKVKEVMKDSMVLVVDAGLTELQPNTETIIGLWPMKKSLCPKVIKKLQVLK